MPARALAALLIGALPLIFAALLWRRVNRLRPVSGRTVVYAVVAGVLLGALAIAVERVVLGWTGLSFEASRAGAAGALLAVFLLAAPLEEGLKLLAVWPLYATRRLGSARLGLTHAAWVGAGFASSEAVLLLFDEGLDGTLGARVVLGLFAQPFFAGMWGYALGRRSHAGGRWFSIAWLSAVVLHALYAHIVFGRGPGLLVMAAPMLFAMGLLSWLALKEVAPSPDSAPPSILPRLPEPPSLRAMQRALKRSDRPLMLHWIALGALVTLGVMIASVALAVYLGHELGIDFASADKSDVRSSGPLVLVGVAILSGFPIAGYLVARASNATSVLEPAMGALVAIGAAVALLSLAAPVAVVFALAVAPLAFGLACGGAWFGLAR